LKGFLSSFKEPTSPKEREKERDKEGKEKGEGERLVACE
jgi:hypothetical protein